MSEDFPPSNPFRRAPRTAAEPDDSQQVRAQQDLARQLPNLDAWSAGQEEKPRTQAKPVKKVRLLSPPHSSPEVDSLPFTSPFNAGQGKDEFQNDPFGSVLSDASDASEPDIASLSRQRAPANPFQKTLATIEHTEGSGTGTSSQAGPGNGRASLDVESFKRLLMTGSATDTNPSTAPSNPARATNVGIHDGTSTEASSVSKQSIFEPIQEAHAESPRTSHEVSDPDEEPRRVSVDSLSFSSDRKKPPPPSSRHGKLIKVELKEETPPMLFDTPSVQNTMNPLSSPLHTQIQPSPTDLNKPLPPAPVRASNDSDRESIFDKEAAGKIPEPPSTSTSVRRKTPPAPPLSRRHTMLASDTRTSKAAPGKLPPKPEDDKVIGSSLDPPLSTSGVVSPPPPPPPRRPTAPRNPSSQATMLTNASSQNDPTSGAGTPLSLSRVQSFRQPSRPQSVTGVEASSKRVSAAPPPPPPRQRASSRTSLDASTVSAGSARASGEYFRTSLQQPRAVRVGSSSSQGAIDILADITALQKEVDALRGQFERKSIS